VSIVGAGPYGLAAAAWLDRARVGRAIFGEPMEFWRRNMPAGMLLRSAWEASHIADPDRALTLDRYEAGNGRALPRPVPLTNFVEYGHWYQRSAVPDVDRRRVRLVEQAAAGFRLELDDGEELRSRRVVVAAGLHPFGRRPAPFDELPDELASHSSEHTDLARFAGRRVLVAGAGQSALESAALLHEHGADVELVARADQLHWLRGAQLRGRLGPLRPLVYPSTDVGPPGLNQLVARPVVFRRFPLSWQGRMAHRSIRPAGARWLVPRLAGVPMTLGLAPTTVAVVGARVHVTFDDGSVREADHVLAATGYRVDVTHYSFLAPQLAAALSLRQGYPLLRRGFESSVEGLHFLGAPAAESYGPLMRFVSGTRFAARALARSMTT
jgi:hypothetical protein